MSARPLLPIVGALGLAGTALLWIALERDPPRVEPMERRLVLPLPSLSGRGGEAAPVVRAAAEAPRTAELPERALSAPEPADPERDPMSVGDVPRPAPGTRSGPLATEFYENGQMMYEAHMRQLADGSWVLDGPWSSWHENGELQEQGAYRDEREHGRWQWWAENGQTVAVGGFLDGAREGPWSFWYEDGGRFMDASYSAGVGSGRWTMYQEGGLRAAEGPYVDGEIAGYWTVWDEEGSIDPERTGTYEAGVRVGD